MTEGLEGLDEAAEDKAGEVGEGAAGLIGPATAIARLGVRGEGGVVGDDAVDADDDVVHEGDEGMEAAGHDAAPPQLLDVADPVEDDKEHRVRQPVEVIDPLLFLHRSRLLRRQIPAARRHSVQIRRWKSSGRHHGVAKSHGIGSKGRAKSAEGERRPYKGAIFEGGRELEKPKP